MNKKAQEEKEKRDQARKNLIDQGLIDAGILEESKDGAPKQKIVYGGKKKKKGMKKGGQHTTPAATTTPAPIKTEDAPATEKVEQEVAKPADSEADKPTPATETPAQTEEKKDEEGIDDDLKMDDWEDLMDDDDAIDNQVKVQVEDNPDKQIEQEALGINEEETITTESKSCFRVLV